MADHRVRWQRITVGVVSALALVGLGYGIRGFTSSNTSAKGFSLVPRTVTVTETSASTSVSASGTIEPSQDQTLNFLTSGTVASVAATVGEVVTPSTLLASLDTAPLQAALDQAQAQLAAAQTKLTTDQDSSAPSATLDADQATVTADTTAVNTAKENLSEASLYSPIDGTVTAVNLASGESVGGTSGQSTNAAATIGITVQSSNSWVVDASVSDANIAGVQDSEQATVDVQGVSEAVYGTVSSVGLVASVANGVATFPVTISVTGDPKDLYAGLPATVSIVTKVEPDVIEIPTLAVHSLTSSPYVLEPSGSGDRKVPITVGTVTGVEVVVTKGLATGDKIVEDVPSFAGARATTGKGAGAFGGGGFGGGGAFGGGGGFGGGGAFGG
ncbi:biotin/lipoyl-binding protein [Ferrimicrobium sp.]|uniref:efflux RND transporter periplasmic adaptor subunit n=1 Tax=Ferrimicrobium sp. TaxID=2926050 RepID=UPI00262EDAD7|nr:biotin/lipoyl-binding protein [Ferrimicrobium sp.]